MMKNWLIASSPHTHGGDTIEKNMRWVLIALIPAYLVSLYYFGLGALLVTTISMASCVVFEALIQKFFLKQPIRVGDGSAIVTGLLLGFNLPSNLPWWMVVLGALVAIGLGKMCYGGLGNNLFNPALVGRVFLLISFPAAMTTWPVPEPFSMHYADAVTAATPLADLANAPAWDQLLFGAIGGSLGETSAIALLIGLVILLASKTITWHIPVSILATVAVFTGILYGVDPTQFANPLVHLCTGGLLLGSIFMATDYATSPMTKKGQIIYGVGIGILTVVIRTWGAYPEGMSFAILLMNAVTPLINTYVRPKRFAAK